LLGTSGLVAGMTLELSPSTLTRSGRASPTGAIDWPALQRDRALAAGAAGEGWSDTRTRSDYAAPDELLRGARSAKLLIMGRSSPQFASFPRVAEGNCAAGGRWLRSGGALDHRLARSSAVRERPRGRRLPGRGGGRRGTFHRRRGARRPSQSRTTEPAMPTLCCGRRRPGRSPPRRRACRAIRPWRHTDGLPTGPGGSCCRLRPRPIFRVTRPSAGHAGSLRAGGPARLELDVATTPGAGRKRAIASGPSILKPGCAGLGQPRFSPLEVVRAVPVGGTEERSSQGGAWTQRTARRPASPRDEEAVGRRPCALRRFRGQEPRGRRGLAPDAARAAAI